LNPESSAQVKTAAQHDRKVVLRGGFLLASFLLAPDALTKRVSEAEAPFSWSRCR
jgi:hypothetical protein